MSDPLLDVQNLKVHFPVGGTFFNSKRFIKAVDDVSFAINEGETLGLVGESGCGKTTIGRSVIRLLDPTSGRILIQGEDLALLSQKELRSRRRKFQMIFQDPYGSLDPRLTIGESVAEGMVIHNDPPTPPARREKVAQLLISVGLEPDHASRFPHEFSGGQRQRIGIARALAAKPRLIVCDEPVSALDVSVQAQIINLLQDLQKESRLAYLFISHDPAVVEQISDRILVMYLGKAVEMGPASAISTYPLHPYTQALIAAAPSLDKNVAEGRVRAPGPQGSPEISNPGRPVAPTGRSLLQPPSLSASAEIPSSLSPPTGCPFHPRCPIAETRCSNETPQWREAQPRHWVACHFMIEDTRSAGFHS